MAYTYLQRLVVLTLLQLCRAQLPGTSSESSWYAANVISDGFQPKPISEIFSTESPFSSTNPIIVLPKSSHQSTLPDELALLSTLAPPRKISSTDVASGTFSRTSMVSQPPTTPLPPTIQTLPPTLDFTPELPQNREIDITQFTEQTIPPSLPGFDFQTDLLRTTLGVSQPIIEQQTTLLEQQPPSSRPAQTQSQNIRFELAPQVPLFPIQKIPDIQPISDRQPQSQTSTPRGLSNYFMIYQQAPQSIQGLPGLTPSEVPPATIAQPRPTTTGTTVIIQPAPTVTVSPPSTRTAPPTSTTPLSSSVRPRTTPATRTTRSDCQNVTMQPSPGKGTQPPIPSLGNSFPLRIRVVAPSGSITNVNINPQTTTTTRKPTTTKARRTSKPKKNNYDACLDGCKGRRTPICAVPLASTLLDPETFKGFPSVCHMACHNSYRKDPYEKILDGRCGRLRTRIKTVDSNTKLKRDELNKAQYVIDNGSKTIVEFTALH